MITAYFYDETFQAELFAELKFRPEAVLYQKAGLIVLKDGPSTCVWAQQVWQNAQVLNFTSIGDAAKKLKAEGRSRAGKWIHSSVENFRRGSLIAEQLPSVKKDEAWKFLDPKAGQVGKAFCLLEPNALLFSEDVFPAKAQGQIQFVETKEAPSRAYLKLWEFFSVYGVRPEAGQLCIDLGSSPGGWTWVLAALGCQVLSVDKAPLAEPLRTNKLVTSVKKDAFTLEPEKVIQEFGPVDWLFSDIICEPSRLCALVQRWLEAKAARNFVCSVKFKGKTDVASLAKLLSIPGSQARHLYHNKHEVTWFLQRQGL